MMKQQEFREICQAHFEIVTEAYYKSMITKGPMWEGIGRLIEKEDTTVSKVLANLAYEQAVALEQLLEHKGR